MTGRTDDGRGWTRRAFVKLAGLTAGLAALGAGLWIGRPGARADRAPDVPDDAAGLRSDDLATLAALAAVLHPPADAAASAELDEAARWWAAGRAAHGGRLAGYRDGLAALAAALPAGRAFHALPAAERESAVAALFRPGSGDAFTALAVELLEGVYASAPGWRTVGYVTWPGVAAPPGEYTRRPAPPPNAGRAA